MKVYEILDPYLAHNLKNPTDSSIMAIHSPEQAAELLKREYKTFVDAYSNSHGRLFRGIKEEKDADIIGAHIRPDRKPLYMGPNNQKLLTKAFDLIGLKANRTNSIFCSSDKYVANSWGEPYIIFVKDGWSGTIFKDIRTDYVFNYAMRVVDDAIMEFEEDETKQVEYIKEQLLKKTPLQFSSSSHLSNIINSNYVDILITGSKYLGLRYSSPFSRETLKILGIK